MSVDGAIRKLQQANDATRAAYSQIEALAEPSDYTDMAGLIAQAASALLKASVQLLQERDESVFELIEQADDFVDAAFEIVNEGELEDEAVEDLSDDGR